ASFSSRPISMNQGRFISRNAQYWRNRPAIIFNDQTISHGELDTRSSRLANALIGLGLRKGDRVAIQAWNRPEIIELECALYKAGLVKVALNARLSAQELIETVGNAEARFLFLDKAHREGVETARAQLECVERTIAMGKRYGEDSEYETLLM